jgi:DNA-binding NtrC family response regulator
MKEDIPLLIDHFIAEISKRKKRDQPRISGESMDCITGYRWPGNVRELENLIERLIILKEGDDVTPDDLPERVHEMRYTRDTSVKTQVLSREGVDLNVMLDEIENNMIVQALEISKGVKSKAAGLLGLNRTTLIEKLKKKAISLESLQK